MYFLRFPSLFVVKLSAVRPWKRRTMVNQGKIKLCREKKICSLRCILEVPKDRKSEKRGRNPQERLTFTLPFQYSLKNIPGSHYPEREHLPWTSKMPPPRDLVITNVLCYLFIKTRFYYDQFRLLNISVDD